MKTIYTTMSKDEVNSALRKSALSAGTEFVLKKMAKSLHWKYLLVKQRLSPKANGFVLFFQKHPPNTFQCAPQPFVPIDAIEKKEMSLVMSPISY